MPQFDPSSFSSQLFWFSICFGLIYISMSKIFLPRVREILKERHTNIGNNHSLAMQIQAQINEIEATNKELRETSADQYKVALDQSTKQISLKRESDLNHLKAQISKMIDHSNLEIIKFKNDSKNDCQKIINKLVDDMSVKFL